MSQVTGTVEAKSNKFGKFSILLDNGTWYSSKYEIKCEKGDVVEFDDGDRKYCQKLKVINGGGGSSSAPAASSGGTTYTPPAKSGFPVPIDTKDRSIVRQNALAHATKIFEACLNRMPAPEKELNAKDFVKFMEKASEDVINIARNFEGYTSGDDDAAEAEQTLKEAS